MEKQEHGLLYAAALTPMHDDLSINTRGLIDHCHRLLGRGCDGIALFGTTGEANSFSVAERIEAIVAVAQSDLAPAQIIVGTGTCSIPETVALTHTVGRFGFGGVLVLPPFYYKNVTENGLFEYYDQLIRRIDDPGLRLFLYNFPRLAGVTLSFDTIDRLVDKHPGIVAGIKESGGDVDLMKRLHAELPAFGIFPGSERVLPHVYPTDSAGCISATANITSPLIRDFMDSGTGPDIMVELRDELDRFPLIPALKFLMADIFGDPAWQNMRPPNRPLDPDRQKQLSAVFDHPDRRHLLSW